MSIVIRRRARLRPGSVYLTVLGVAMVVSLMGMAILYQSRIELRNARSEEERAQARMVAQSAVGFALGRVELDSSWRTNYTNLREEPNSSGTVTPVDVLGAEMTFRFIDSDGDLADDADDDVEIHGIGRAGDAVFIYSATATPNGTKLELVPGSWVRVESTP